jgi:hypothetical protein
VHLNVALNGSTLVLANRRPELQTGALAGFQAPVALSQDGSLGKLMALTYSGGARYGLDIDGKRIVWDGGSVSIPTLTQAGGLAVTGGFAYVTGYGDSCIYRVDLASGLVDVLAGSKGTTGATDGTGAAARFNYPVGIVLAGGNLYVADSLNHAIRKVTLGGVVSTLAGGNYGATDAVGAAAGFRKPFGLAADDQGILYVADYYNNRIRRVDPATQAVTTLAGTTAGETDGAGGQIQLTAPTAVAWGRYQGQPVLVVGELDTGKLRLLSFWH